MFGKNPQNRFELVFLNGQTRPLFVYFHSFRKTNRYSTNLTINFKVYMVDSNPGRQDGRRRRIYSATYGGTPTGLDYWSRDLDTVSDELSVRGGVSASFNFCAIN